MAKIECQQWNRRNRQNTTFCPRCWHQYNINIIHSFYWFPRVQLLVFHVHERHVRKDANGTCAHTHKDTHIIFGFIAVSMLECTARSIFFRKYMYVPQADKIRPTWLTEIQSYTSRHSHKTTGDIITESVSVRWLNVYYRCVVNICVCLCVCDISRVWLYYVRECVLHTYAWWTTYNSFHKFVIMRVQAVHTQYLLYHYYCYYVVDVFSKLVKNQQTHITATNDMNGPI